MSVSLELKLEDLDRFTFKLAKNIDNFFIIGLIGELGSGKTTFSKSLLKKLGVTDQVISPTYSIENIYMPSKNMLVRHIDLYRGVSLEMESEILTPQAKDSNELVLIEWFNLLKFPKVKPNLKITFGFNLIEGESHLFDAGHRILHLEGSNTLLKHLSEGFLLKN